MDFRICLSSIPEQQAFLLSHFALATLSFGNSDHSVVLKMCKWLSVLKETELILPLTLTNKKMGVNLWILFPETPHKINSWVFIILYAKQQFNLKFKANSFFLTFLYETLLLILFHLVFLLQHLWLIHFSFTRGNNEIGNKSCFWWVFNLYFAP